MPYFFRSLRISLWAARLSRLGCTSSSRTSPSASTARHSALDSSPHPITLLPHGVVHPRPRCVQGLVLLPQVDVDGAARLLARRAQGPGRTSSVMRAAELSLDPRAAVLSALLAPGYRGLALWAGDPFVLPVDGKVGQVITLVRPGSARSTRPAPDLPAKRHDRAGCQP